MQTRNPRFLPVADKAMQTNFDRLEEYLAGDILGAFHGRFIQLTFTAAVTAYKVPHGLRVTPKDVIQLYKTDGVTVTWLPDSFTSTDVCITTSGACTVRAFVGLYRS